MSNDLYIPYDSFDTDMRPLPPGVNFWSNSGVGLDSSPGGGAADPNTYILNQQNLIQVDVRQKLPSDVFIPIVFVEVWVCNPSTIAGPDSALPISEGSDTTILTGSSPTTAHSTTVTVSGFIPYMGISPLPGGHVCLIANCFGSNGDGQSLRFATTADFATLVQTDGHVAQRNIFAASVPMKMSKRLSFPFNAVAAVPKGEEKVALELQTAKEDADLTSGDRAFLHKGPYRDLPLHASKVPLKAFAIDGAPGGPARRVSLDVHAGHPTLLSILVETDPGERAGGVHVFDVIQKTISGHVQGGIRLLAVIT